MSKFLPDLPGWTLWRSTAVICEEQSSSLLSWQSHTFEIKGATAIFEPVPETWPAAELIVNIEQGGWHF